MDTTMMTQDRISESLTSAFQVAELQKSKFELKLHAAYLQSLLDSSPGATVVLNNGGMATYPGGYPTARELYGTTEMIGDYAKIAEGMGAVGITVKEPGEVADAIREAQKHNAEGRTVLLDIHTNLEAKRSFLCGSS